MYDHAQSPRIGQKLPPESPGIRMFSGSEIPEAAYRGQMIYRTDTERVQVFNGTAWTDVAGGDVTGTLTFVGDTPPVALSIGDIWYDSSNGHLIHYWDGATWTEVPIGSGAIEGSAILPLHLATGSVTADSIAAGTLTGDLFAGEMILGSTIRSGALDADGNIVGAYVEEGPDGIVLFDASNQAVVRLPTDTNQAAYFQGDIQAKSLRVLGGTSIESIDNMMSSEAALMLSAGVSSPIAPPQITQGWNQIRIDTNTAISPGMGSYSGDPGFGDMGISFLNPSQIIAVCWDGFFHRWFVSQAKPEYGSRSWYIDADGSILGCDDWVDKYNLSVCYRNDAHPGTAYLWETPQKDWGVWGNTPGGTGAINNVPHSWIENTGLPPVIGWDDVNGTFYLAQSANNLLSIRRFHFVATFGANAVSDSVTTLGTGTGFQSKLCGIDFGQRQGTAANRFTMSISDNLNGYVMASGSGGLQIDNEKFPLASRARAFCWDGTQFVSIDSTGLLSTYENNLTTSASQIIWAAYSQYDSDDSSGGAKHETTIGAKASITRKKRSLLTITMPPVLDKGRPDDPDMWRLYMARSDTEPAPSAMWRQAEGGSPTASTSVTLSTLLLSGTAANTGTPIPFPGSTPARIYSSQTDGVDAIINLQGDGAGRVGPLSWDSSGVGVISPKAGTQATGTMVAGTTKAIAVTFAAAYPVGITPRVTLTVNIANPDDMLASLEVGSTSRTGFTIRALRPAGTLSQNIDWIAVPNTG